MPSYTGTVRDLDFIANLGWCQAILAGDPGELVATTTDARIQALLELAFATGEMAAVEYDEGEQNTLTRVKVNRESAGLRAAAPEMDEDPAAPAPGDEDRASKDEYETAVDRTNYGEDTQAAAPPKELAEGVHAKSLPPTLAIAPAALKQFVDACRAAGVTYGLGKKVPKHGANPGTGFTKVDCSGFVREAIWRAASHQEFPDGSVVQREHVQKQGYAHGTPGDGLKQDGAVRIAFLRPQDVSSGIGHVVLIHNAKTYESHGGTGPDSRVWTNTGWQAKTLVFVLTPAPA